MRLQSSIQNNQKLNLAISNFKTPVILNNVTCLLLGPGFSWNNYTFLYVSFFIIQAFCKEFRQSLFLYLLLDCSH